jgi:hypothetical protein
VPAATAANGVPQATNNLPIVSQRATWQSAAEAVVPILSRAWRPLPVDALELNLSASHEANDTAGQNQSSQRTFEAASKGSSTYVVATKLQVTRDLALRASFTEGFYPPDWNDVSDLVNPSTVTPSVGDPKRGNTIQTATYTLMNGGNPNVQAESARSRNFGVLFTPRFLPGLSLTVDYWKTKKEDAILRTNFVQVISFADDFASYITRAAPTAAEQAQGWLGVITEVRTGPINVSQLQTDGVDVQAKYDLRTTSAGQFLFNANASFTNVFETQTTPSAVVINTAGAGGPLRWRGYGSVTWVKNAFSTTLTGRYVGHYSSATTARTVAFPTSTGLDGGRIPAFLHWDLQLTYEIPYRVGDKGWRRWVNGTRWTLGALNVLNEAPSFVSDGAAFYNRQADPRQRFVYVQLKKSL